VEEAAAGFRNIQCESKTQISRVSVPLLPLKETMNAAAPTDASMTMSALMTLAHLSDERSESQILHIQKHRHR
jgi:hypothetical protein